MDGGPSAQHEVRAPDSLGVARSLIASLLVFLASLPALSRAQEPASHTPPGYGRRPESADVTRTPGTEHDVHFETNASEGLALFVVDGDEPIPLCDELPCTARLSAGMHQYRVRVGIEDGALRTPHNDTWLTPNARNLEVEFSSREGQRLAGAILMVPMAATTLAAWIVSISLLANSDPFAHALGLVVGGGSWIPAAGVVIGLLLMAFEDHLEMERAAIRF